MWDKHKSVSFHSQIWQRALTKKNPQQKQGDLGFLSLEIECVWTEDRGEPSIDRSIRRSVYNGADWIWECKE